MLSSRIEVLYKEITKIPEMAAYSKAEEDLNILMTAINMTISSYIGAEEYTQKENNDDCTDWDEGGCSHNCANCTGCH